MTVNAQTMLELADKVVGIQEYLPNEDDRNALGQAAHYLRDPSFARKPGAELGREAIARKIAEWMGYSFDDLHAHSVVERGFREWLPDGYHGGKPDLLRFADALMAHTRPENENCVTCGLPKSEHHYNGAAYGVCGDYTAHTRPDSNDIENKGD